MPTQMTRSICQAVRRRSRRIGYDTDGCSHYIFLDASCAALGKVIVPILTHKEKDRKCYAAFPAKIEC